MQLVRDSMSQSILYVTRDATVRTAVELLRSHAMDLVPVVESGRVIGLLDALSLTMYDGEVSVLEAMTTPAITVDCNDTMAAAAMVMRTHRLRQLPVLRDGQLAGFLSSRDLLAMWGTIHDPLTGLPVQHQLRHWVHTVMGSGREISILFLDLNEFGELNKAQGHVYGDHVLQCVADAIREAIEPELDFVCRYGGDEFAVATTRPLHQARELAVRLRERVGTVCLADGPIQTGVSIGIAGGQRLKARSGAHIEATLDDLLTRASTASTRAKAMTEGIAMFQTVVVNGAPTDVQTQVRQPLVGRVLISSYRVRNAGNQMEVVVSLLAGERTEERRIYAREDEIHRAVAAATADCLQRLAPRGVAIEVTETYEFTTPQGVACVGATVEIDGGNGAVERLVGTSPVRGDVLRTYIHAVLDATNRRLARV